MKDPVPQQKKLAPTDGSYLGPGEFEPLPSGSGRSASNSPSPQPSPNQSYTRRTRQPDVNKIPEHLRPGATSNGGSASSRLSIIGATGSPSASPSNSVGGHSIRHSISGTNLSEFGAIPSSMQSASTASNNRRASFVGTSPSPASLGVSQSSTRRDSFPVSVLL